jgi:hypothetical protein
MIANISLRLDHVKNGQTPDPGFHPGLCCCALSALGFVFSSLKAHAPQSRSKKYGHEKKSKIQHFCARKLLKTLGRFFAKSIFSHDLCGIRRDAGAAAKPQSKTAHCRAAGV